jgi:hypothetical protein
MKPKRRKRGAHNLPAIRRGEIERHALHVGAADTEDFWRWLVAWAWHNGQNGRDPTGALMMAAARIGRRGMSEAEADDIIEQAQTMRQRRTADKLARFLGMTCAQRQQLGITTIGSIDVDRKQRERRRKGENRMDHERSRRARGAKPRADYEANSLTRTKPWEAEGVGRRTWYRRRGTSPSAATSPPKDGGTNGTSPSAAIFLTAADTPVPPERKKAGLPRGSLSEKRGGNSSTHSALREESVSVSVDSPGPAWCPHDVDEPSYTQWEVDEAFEASCAGLEDKPWYGVRLPRP